MEHADATNSARDEALACTPNPDNVLINHDPAFEPPSEARINPSSEVEKANHAENEV